MSLPKHLFIVLALAACGPRPAPTTSATLAAASTPRPAAHVVDLADHRGATFFDVMNGAGGIKADLDADYATPFQVADRDTAIGALDDVSDKVKRKVTRAFDEHGDVRELGQLSEALQGRSFTPAALRSAIGREGVTPWAVGDFLQIASGASTLVLIDGANFYYNVSYEPDEVKSGRSFGTGPAHKADDASYPFYLDELTKHLDHTDDALPFYDALLKILTASDPSAVASLAPDAQTVLTDFVTIYTAELYRHVIAGLGSRAPWENDLAEATMVSLWSHAVGKVQQDGRLVEGTPRDWNGVGPNGSGVGITRRDRRALQIKICDAVRALSPGTVPAIESHLDGAESVRRDCYRAITEFLNDRDTQGAVRAEAPELAHAVTTFLRYTRDHAAEILARLQ